MEFCINIATTDLKITVPTKLTEREIKLIEVLVLNIAATANAFVTGKDMAFNPLDKDGQDIFNFRFAWQKSLEEALYNQLEENLKRRIETAFKMSDIQDVMLTFNVNSYMTT